ncbi:DsbE family thiol:disulfide interchange protein [Bartonella sp. WD16.2]|uniref:DsbE family thiol:disulfide interchange protein n=1 Tax=Bartonella sp. WD16.2 TaxID=1933904 RepID=UPI00099ABD79|nr:DsbE family thiol:disulfide interchange protein [Bartonella sp. WD16.2]AQX20661.1 cytochrome c biogenesis protein CcmG, thiol:disulfide interchange protein DsbE [Bartonella sp. WD16.2]
MKITPFKFKKSISLPILFGLLAPFFLFLLLILLLFSSIKNKHSNDLSLTSNILIGKPAPKTNLPLLNKDDDLNSEQFKGRITLINFWGSWCPPCREEHPILMKIAKDHRFDLIGINFKDNKENAKRFLTHFGNPFKLIGFDVSNHTAINWGVYGPPETFVLDKESIIIARHIGPLTWQIYQKEILPKIEKAITVEESSNDKLFISPK